MRFPVALVLAVWATAAAADLYRWIDPESGSIKYSSYPPPWYGDAEQERRAPKVERIPARQDGPAPSAEEVAAPPAARPAVPTAAPPAVPPTAPPAGKPAARTEMQPRIGSFSKEPAR